MDLNSIASLVSVTVTAGSAIVAVVQYMWNSRPHYTLIKRIDHYNIGEPKDSLSIQIANTGKLGMNIALKGITTNKAAGEGQRFMGAISFPRSMTNYQKFEPNEVKDLISFTSDEFYHLLSYKTNSHLYRIIETELLADHDLSFYVWTVDYKQQTRPIRVIVAHDEPFYQHLRNLMNAKNDSKPTINLH
ncbi:hypothetical protein ACYATP_08375 [Lactobacillaceae bacterium Melli_B4]